MEVGSRVLAGREKATVRYIGSVAGQNGTWVGLEWDNAARGKHDGSSGGMRYFTCVKWPNAGSFVRIEKVDPGLSLLEAIRLRYTNQKGEGEAGDGVVQQQGAPHRNVQFQIVGEDKVKEKQSQIHTLETARLVHMDVARMDEPDLLAQNLPQLRELDLTSNLIHSWQTVSDLFYALPGLAFINLTGNLLQLPSPSAQAPGLTRTLTSLRGLVLNSCEVTWQQVCHLQTYLPCLEELHLCKNSITTLDPAGPSGSSPVSTAGAKAAPAVAAAAATAAAAANGPSPSAAFNHDRSPDQGVVNSQQSSHAEAQPEQQQQQAQHMGWAILEGRDSVPLLFGFRNLQVLGLEGNSISSWAEVCRLAGLPQLKRLQLSGNPICSVVYPRLSVDPVLAPPATTTQDPGAAAAATAVAGDRKTSAEGPNQALAAAAAQRAEAVAGPSTVQGGPAAFPQLEALLLGQCLLGSWADVNQLDLFPCLAELRLSGNPLVADARAGRRFEVIGRVHGLGLLNGADVKTRERRDCELAYYESILADIKEAGADGGAAAAVQAAHPRLGQLRERFGAISVSAAKGPTQGSSLGSRAVEVLLRSGSKSSKKKLPGTSTIGSVKLLCSRLFKIAPDRQLLLLHAAPGQGPGGPCAAAAAAGSGACSSFGATSGGEPEEISYDDTQTLAYFDVQAGCVIEVLEDDPQLRQEMAARQQLQQKAQQEERSRQQLQQGDRLRQIAAGV